ncbi:MAG: class A beta-lactamase [Kordiimonadaceae bacterium]|nr:class A beta-lactamase [Kordiimonadaceae bacterium]
MKYVPLRRSLLAFSLTMPFYGFGLSLIASAQEDNNSEIHKKLSDLEKKYGGRLGISMINTGDNSIINHRGDERFPFCSTFKLMLSSAILQESISNPDLLNMRINYSEADKVTYSPISEKHFDDGMTIAELCAAAVQYSDNTAANLLIRHLGGPEAVTQFARSIGDEMFRLDRWETELNSAVPGDPRDTTTPGAMAKSIQKLVLGDGLPKKQQLQLQEWLKGNTTGDTRIRAGVPKGWIVGDKTGSGAYGVTNDIGVIWPENGAPIVLAVYYAHTDEKAPNVNEVVADATRILISG